MRYMTTARGLRLGFSTDRRKRRHQHRVCARKLLDSGIILHTRAPDGSTAYAVAQWHLYQARRP